MKKVKRQKFKNEIFLTHIIKNEKQYIISLLFFAIGLFWGIIFFNNSDILHQEQITEVLKMNVQNNFNNVSALTNILKSNLILALLMWIMGSTLIGIVFVLGIVCFRGFCFGYTICSIVYTFGTIKGVVFSITSLMLHNLLFIPALLIASVSSLNLCKYILKEKNYNFKLCLIKHTSVCALVSILFSISAFVEIFVSKILASRVWDYIKF